MTSTPSQQKREAFEKWAESEYLPCDLTPHPGNPTTYVDLRIHNACQGWQARGEYEQERVKKLFDQLLNGGE